MYYVGMDIGSTCAKTAILDENKELLYYFVVPTGWSSFEALKVIEEKLKEYSILMEECKICSTGYGRKAVAYSHKKVTEITCHAKGAQYLFEKEKMNVIDVGGQDTKVITCKNGKVQEFFMNDKCSAGTGKFVEIMANRLTVPIDELAHLAKNHTEQIKISSMCTVFAESEIVSLVGQGTSKENIAWGVINSIAMKVKQEYGKLHTQDLPIVLTGGLCECDYFVELLSIYIGQPIETCNKARFAGAIGAALLADV